MARTINGIAAEQRQFAFDGCHKIYLLANEAEEQEAKSYHYEILPIEKLPEVWEGACPLRFIYSWDLGTPYVSQFEEPVTFDGFE